MRRIAAEAQVSLAGIYHYVAGKDELLYWTRLHTFDSLSRGPRAASKGSSTRGNASPQRCATTWVTSAPTWPS